MIPTEMHFLLTVTLLGIGVMTACWMFWEAGRARQTLQDLSVQMLSGAWLVYLLAMLTLLLAPKIDARWIVLAHYVEYVGLQLLMVCIGLFLLLTARVMQPWVYFLLAGQAAIGLVALNWRPSALAETFSNFGRSSMYPVWVSVNLVAASVVAAMIFICIRKNRSVASLLALSGCLLGIGLYVDLVPINDEPGRLTILLQEAYALFLWMVWRMTGAHVKSSSPVAVVSTGFPPSTDMSLLSDFGPTADVTAVAVAQERRRIGQDLHDGIASQLVSILSSLDNKLPSTVPLALALEQCLVDLKMTVDALDTSNDNILDALGRLRYRTQHSLDKLGIKMSWRVEVRDELEAVRGEAAVHVLRIAQESLANVMMHARATAVEVVCRYVPESCVLVLEVRDNGQGISRQKDANTSVVRQTTSLGKGLSNMRLRAKSAGGDLTVSSKAGLGTRVRLTLPISYTATQSAPSFDLKSSAGASDRSAFRMQ